MSSHEKLELGDTVVPALNKPEVDSIGSAWDSPHAQPSGLLSSIFSILTALDKCQHDISSKFHFSPLMPRGSFLDDLGIDRTRHPIARGDFENYQLVVLEEQNSDKEGD